MANLIKSSGIMRSVAILIFRIFPRGVHDKNNISFVLNQDHLMFFSFVPISFFFFSFLFFYKLLVWCMQFVILSLFKMVFKNYSKFRIESCVFY